MSSKAGLLLASIAAGLCIVVSGCAPSARLSLQFAPGRSETYDVTTEVTKVLRFEQPSINKLRDEQTTTVVTVGFTQTVTDVDAEGIAAADVRIDALSVLITSSNEEQLSFDSAKEADRAKLLSNLIGQRYSVRISPEGKVVGYDSTAARQAIALGRDLEKRMAERLLNEQSIRQRHEIPALWGFGENTAVNQSWSRVITPSGPMVPKSYRQVYTLADVQTRDRQKVAVVEMKAEEAAETPTAPMNAYGMAMLLGPFAGKFDNLDEYAGTLLLNLDTGTVLEYNETLVNTLLGQDTPTSVSADKGPDTLIMRYIERITMQKR